MPARDLLAEMLLDLTEPAQALREFEASRQTEPNGCNRPDGAAKAADLSGDPGKAKAYSERLVAICEGADTEGPKAGEAKAFSARR